MNRLKKYTGLIIIVILAGLISGFGLKKKNNKTYDYIITISTEYGDMKLILFDDTPIHKANFIKLAEEGKYDSTTFHRIINNFMIQGGMLKDRDMAGWDTLSFEQKTLPNEIMEKHKHIYGAVAAARTNNPEKRSDLTQFYIVNNPKGAHFLDNNYTVFGQLMIGWDVLQKISTTEVNNSAPVKPVYMRVKVDKVKRSELILFYGDVYKKYHISQ
jgi:cyclophilin family peptidyl-prolyl cis-trans isomerase